MAQNSPQVRDQRLYPNPHTNAPALCTVGSREWYAWLKSATRFRYQTSQRLPVHARYSRAMRPISVRKEKRRRGYLWYANLRVHGILYKRYVGRTSDLSIERLDLIALDLNQQW